MKSTFVFLVAVLMIFSACNDDDENGTSNRFQLLTSHSWQSDSLLVNGADASGEGQMLANFVGEAKFNEDGTGNFGSYSGTWSFSQNETQLVIQSEELDFPLVTNIEELTATSLKVTTSLPNPTDPLQPFNIRMTFRPG